MEIGLGGHIIPSSDRWGAGGVVLTKVFVLNLMLIM